MTQIRSYLLPADTAPDLDDVLWVDKAGGVTRKITLTTLRNTLGGGALVAEQTLIGWTEAGSYEVTAATYDSDGVVTTATVKWPDASAGTFTTVTKNTTWLAVDAYTITHAASGQTVTQAAVTRDAVGNVTVKPALTIT